MASEDRLKQAVAAAAYSKGLTSGYPHLFDTEINELGTKLGAPDHEVRQVVRALCDEFLLIENSRGYYHATPFLLLYHEAFDREGAYRQNAIRRYLLHEMGELDKTAGPSGVPFVQVRWDENEPYEMNEMFIAAHVLDGLGLISMSDRGLPAIFGASLTSRGYDALRDERLVAELLPVTPTEDESEHAAIAPDALKTLIVSCEQLLDERGWKQALVELGRGDKEYGDRDWVNAVREYYAALESGFKYALGEELTHDDGRAPETARETRGGNQPDPTELPGALRLHRQRPLTPFAWRRPQGRGGGRDRNRPCRSVTRWESHADAASLPRPAPAGNRYVVHAAVARRATGRQRRRQMPRARRTPVHEGIRGCGARRW